MARYAGLLLDHAEGFGRGRGFFCPSGNKKSFLCSSNLGNWMFVRTSLSVRANFGYGKQISFFFPKKK